MTKKIFFGIITICLLSVAAVIIIVTAILYGSSAETAAAQARTDARLIASTRRWRRRARHTLIPRTYPTISA